MTQPASELHARDVLSLEGGFYKVLSVNLHTGGGKSGAMVHARLRHLETGNISEKRFATTEKMETIPVEFVHMQFLYAQDEDMVFMNPASYEQYTLKKTAIGPGAIFLKEEDTIDVEMFEGKPLGVSLPETLILKVASTGEGLRGDATFKEAVLDNGVTVMVPQFVREGDMVRLNVETREFVDRVREKSGPEKQTYKPTKQEPKKV